MNFARDSFEDAIEQAAARATKILRGVEDCWVKDMNSMIEHDNIMDYKTNVESTFQPDSRRTPPSVEE